MSEESLKGVVIKANELFRLRDKHTIAKAEASAIWEEVEKRQRQLTELLLDAGITKIPCDEGLFFLETKTEFGVSDYDELRNYLLENNMHQMLTVHATRLQSFCKVEFEQKGELPKGIYNKGESTTPKMRKGKHS